MRVAVLVKQVPRAETLELLASGRLKREGVELEMNAYCRRAVSKGVQLASEFGGSCTVFTLGPSSAEDCLREAVAWGADKGVLISDTPFAGSDTLATARALASALEMEGPFDLVLLGRNSIDADTGQVPPQLAQLLGLPFAAGVKELNLSADSASGYTAEALCEHDDGWKRVRLGLPAILSVAERLCEPAKVDPEGRAAVPAERILTITAGELGPGPFGQAGSPTSVGSVRIMEVERHRIRLSGPIEQQAEEALSLLESWGAIGAGLKTPDESDGSVEPVHRATQTDSSTLVAVVIEPERARMARELLGEAAELAGSIGGMVAAFDPTDRDALELNAWGADRVVRLSGSESEEDVSRALAGWCRSAAPWAVLVPGTLWGREVAGRSSADLGAGLTGDAVGFGVEDGRLVAWKPAFGGRLVAAITATSEIQMATVRPGVLGLRTPRAGVVIPQELLEIEPAGRVELLEQARDDDVEVLLSASALVCVGAGVPPDEYASIEPLLKALGAELAGTRKVTDKGWLPRARQVGITGHSVAPGLYVALGVQGKFNHTIGTRSAGAVLAVNSDPDAPVFDWADVGIVGDWREAVQALLKKLESA